MQSQWYHWLEMANYFVSPCASCRKDHRCLLKQAGYTSAYEIPSYYKTYTSPHFCPEHKQVWIQWRDNFQMKTWKKILNLTLWFLYNWGCRRDTLRTVKSAKQPWKIWILKVQFVINVILTHFREDPTQVWTSYNHSHRMILQIYKASEISVPRKWEDGSSVNSRALIWQF